MTKKIPYIIIPALVCVVMAACESKQAASLDEFTRDVYTPQYASGFNIRGTEDGKSVLITVSNPWQGADSVVSQLFVARNGEQAPDGFTGQVINGDAQRIVAMSSTNIALLDAVGLADHIVGVSGMQYISNPTIQARRDSVADVGYEGNVNYELLLSLNPDIVLLYSVSGASAMEAKLNELGIPYLYVGDYVEESPLGKAEWLVALAELAGKGCEGQNAFKAIPERYSAIKERLTSLQPEQKLPLVLLNTPYAGSWFLPPMESYAVTLVKDAGGEYVYSKNTSNAAVAVDMEEAYSLASNADYWINTGMARTLQDVRDMCPKFTDVSVFSSGQIYNNTLKTTAAGGNDYYESGVVNPDLVLRDLMKIFHPELVPEPFTYYKKLE